MNNVFLLSWKKAWIIVVGVFISILLHNAISAIFNTEEAFFFIVVVFIIPIYLLIAIIYSIIYYIKKKGGVNMKKKASKKEKCEMPKCGCHTAKCSGGCFYFLTFIGAAIHYISSATGFWSGVVAFLKAIVWPVFVTMGLLKFLGL